MGIVRSVIGRAESYTLPAMEVAFDGNGVLIINPLNYTTMKTNLLNTDYVIYDKANDHVIPFSNGDIVIFGNKNEADAYCRGNEVVIPCTELPIHWKKILLNQINNQSK